MRTTTRTMITRITDRTPTATGPTTATVTGIIDDRITELIGAMADVWPAVLIGDGTSGGPEARSGLVGEACQASKGGWKCRFTSLEADSPPTQSRE
jgi:hypothetical protein